MRRRIAPGIESTLWVDLTSKNDILNTKKAEYTETTFFQAYDVIRLVFERLIAMFAHDSATSLAPNQAKRATNVNIICYGNAVSIASC